MESVRVARVSDHAAERDFLRLEETVRGGAQPGGFADPAEAVRRARGGNGVCLLAKREKAPAARALLLARGEDALFSLFAALPDEEAVRALIDAMRSEARGWGCARLIGPVPPDGAGFGIGVQITGSAGDAPWHPADPPYLAGLLRGAGLRERERWLTMERPLGANPFAGAAIWAARRGIGTDVMPLARRRTLDLALAVCETSSADRGAFEQIYARVCALAPQGLAAAACARGEPVGWLLCASEGEVFRLLQMQILPRWRGSPCAAALLDTAWSEAARRGAGTLVAGTIAADNAVSLPMAVHAGMRPRAAWAVLEADL